MCVVCLCFLKLFGVSNAFVLYNAFKPILTSECVLSSTLYKVVVFPFCVFSSCVLFQYYTLTGVAYSQHAAHNNVLV